MIQNSEIIQLLPLKMSIFVATEHCTSIILYIARDIFKIFVFVSVKLLLISLGFSLTDNVQRLSYLTFGYSSLLSLFTEGKFFKSFLFLMFLIL